MKKYLAIVLLLTVLFVPMKINAMPINEPLFVRLPGDNDTNTTNDNTIDNDNDLNDNNDTFDNDLNDNNRNDNNNNTGITGYDTDLDNNDLNDDVNNNYGTYIIIGLSGIVLGALGTYLFTRRD